jgi:hypothetical protein
MWPQAEMPRAFAGKHGMVSFEHQEQIEVAAEVCQSVVLDNGAFSAWKRSKRHNFDGYAVWAEEWLKHPCVEWCVIPDAIDGDEQANDDLLASWPLDGSRSVPVYHMHESLDRLTRLMGAYPRVALGSSGKWADPGSSQWWARMGEVMAACTDDEGMPLTKLHGLRMLDPLIFAQLPLSSADSCNVARNVGIDSKWVGPYVPTSKAMRALVIMDRIERHASARRWIGQGQQHNLELLG